MEMVAKNDNEEMNKILDALRGIVGALNSNGVGTNHAIPVALARLETRLDHLERTLANMQKILIGLALSVVSLVIKMLAEGVLLK